MKPPPNPQCNATSRSGERCKQSAVAGRTKCRFHGGRSLPPGPSHPSYKHGRYSKALIGGAGGLAAAYAASEADGELLSVRAEIALLQSRALQLTKRLGTSESVSRWKELLNAWRSFQSAGRDKDATAAQAAIVEIGRLVESGAQEQVQWAEIANILDRKSVLAGREHARTKDLCAMIPAAEALAMAAALAESVRARVSDEKIVRAIAADIDGILFRSPAAASMATARRLGVSGHGSSGESIDGVIIEPPPAAAECEQTTASDASIKVENSNSETLSTEPPNDAA